MATTGVADNNQSFIKRAGTVGMSDVQSVIQPSGLRNSAAFPSEDGRILSRDTEFKLGDRNARAAAPGQLYYNHERKQAASGYNVHWQPIEAITNTATTFGRDEANDDDGRVDAGTWYFRRSNTITENSFPLKIN